MKKEKNEHNVIMGVGETLRQLSPNEVVQGAYLAESILYEVEVDDNTSCDRVVLLVYEKRRGKSAKPILELHIPKNKRVVFAREQANKRLEWYGKKPRKHANGV